MKITIYGWSTKAPQKAGAEERLRNDRPTGAVTPEKM